MKGLVAIALLLAGCPGNGDDGECKVDDDCSSSRVCARNGECLSPSAVRAARVTWTIRGVPANTATCAATPNFFILFYAQPGDTFGFEPVPCAAGVFSIDKLPTRFISVEIGNDGFQDDKAFDAQGHVAFDLFP